MSDAPPAIIQQGAVDVLGCAVPAVQVCVPGVWSDAEVEAFVQTEKPGSWHADGGLRQRCPGGRGLVHLAVVRMVEC
jgi:hypothetical protein